MRVALAVTAVELRRFLADRSNIFFAFVFPLLLVLFMGSQFGGGGGGTVALSGAPGALRDDLVATLEDRDADVTVTEADGVRELVARGRADVGLVLPPEASAAYDAGEDLDVPLVLGTQARSQITAQLVEGALADLATRAGQLAALEAAGIGAADAEAALAAARDAVPPVRMQVANVSEIAQAFSGLGRFDYGASSQLLIFVFLISLAGSSTLIQARRHGVLRRTLAAPVTAGQAVGGQTLARLAIATFQGAYIMAATTLLFGVDWGNLAVAALVMVVFALVAAGGAMVIGAALDSESAASGLGVGLALVLGALGGAMYPIELFPDTLRTVAHATPHAWASSALADVQRYGGGLVDVLPEIGVLLVFAAVLLGVGAWLLRRSLARAM